MDGSDLSLGKGESFELREASFDRQDRITLRLMPCSQGIVMRPWGV